MIVLLLMTHQHGESLDCSQPKTHLVTEFPFNFSMHPVYTSIYSIQIGAAMLLNNGVLLLAVLAMGVVIHYGVVVCEEAYLRKKFGRTYSEYHRKTSRYI